MTGSAGFGPLRWVRAVGHGLYRSAVVTGVTGVLPAVVVPVAFFGFRFARSWSDDLSAPLAVQMLVYLGEVAMTLVWTGVAGWFVVAFVSRPLSEVARWGARRWLGVSVEPQYNPVLPVTRMATGFWWNGYAYHESEREARRRATLDARRRDPQLRRDVLWLVVAAVTVLPAAAVPLACLAAGGYLLTRPDSLGYGVALCGVGLAVAPFGWRLLGPVGRPLLGGSRRSMDRRVEELEAIRADLTQTQAAELERIERGLHDGAQARLVALGMSMGAAERLVDQDPARAKEILAQARSSSAAALSELRALVRGINPPVLAERGLVDAVRALALDAALPVEVRSTVPARPERPVESAVYFAVAELLANAVKHARASRVQIDLDYGERVLSATVTADGVGGVGTADTGAGLPGAGAGPASGGSGLAGIERRMAAFGGVLRIDSPAGGPSRITVAVPCELS
jgi:signal transduction histidine kinase